MTANKAEKSQDAKKVFDIIKKVLWGVLIGLFAFLVFIVGWLAVDKFIVKSPVPSVFGYATLTIETGSMNGYSAMVKDGKPKQVSIGDMIVIKKTGDYTIGDVITFLPEGDKVPTTHRIIGYTENGYITKGDANNIKDTVPIEKERVLGEVVMHSPGLGRFSGWVKKEGWIYLLSGLAIIAIGAFVITLSNEEENTEENNDGAKKPADATDGAKKPAEQKEDPKEGTDKTNEAKPENENNAAESEKDKASADDK